MYVYVCQAQYGNLQVNTDWYKKYECLGESLQLSCPQGKWIVILQVMYGRQNRLCGYCTENDFCRDNIQKCWQSDEALSVVYRK